MSLFKTIHTIRFDTIDSTHTWGKKNISTIDPDALTCITALEQTASLGRRHQRRWVSPKGCNILATFCFFLPKTNIFTSNLGQVFSLSAASFLEKEGFFPEIKWPNDVRVQGKKIMGILCEALQAEDRIGIVLSFGLNVNMPEEILRHIDQPATSLAILSGTLWDLDAVLKELLDQFISDLTILKAQGFSCFRDRYEQLLAYKGQTIRCFDGTKFLEGICHAILPDGRLELLLTEGSTVHLSAGELLNTEQ
jgi:BirA family biotin operon repressor/biotin-[acetyl-CoA-carboxylase] ligase